MVIESTVADGERIPGTHKVVGDVSSLGKNGFPRFFLHDRDGGVCTGSNATPVRPL